jgi:hypothetical protein
MSTALKAPGYTAPIQAPRLLVLALAPLIAFMTLAHTIVEGDSASTMTPTQLDERAALWIVVAVLWVLPVVIAGVAFAAIASTFDGGTRLRLLAGFGVALLAGHVAAQAALIVLHDTRTLAHSTTYALAILLSLVGWWVIDVVAALTCLQLFRRGGSARKTSAVVGVVTGLFLLLEIAVYLPALVGRGELHDTIGLPPMLLPIIWAVLGGVLWRSRGSRPEAGR